MYLDHAVPSFRSRHIQWWLATYLVLPFGPGSSFGFEGLCGQAGPIWIAQILWIHTRYYACHILSKVATLILYTILSSLPVNPTFSQSF